MARRRAHNPLEIIDGDFIIFRNSIFLFPNLGRLVLILWMITACGVCLFFLGHDETRLLYFSIEILEREVCKSVKVRGRIKEKIETYLLEK